jgi:hypothetical protein
MTGCGYSPTAGLMASATPHRSSLQGECSHVIPTDNARFSPSSFDRVELVNYLGEFIFGF